VKVEVGLKFQITFLTQHVGLSIFDPNLGWNNTALFRYYELMNNCILQHWLLKRLFKLD